MMDENDNWIYVVETDAKAVSAAIRHRQIFVLALIPVLLGIMGLILILQLLDDLAFTPLPILLGSLVAVILLVMVAYLIVPRYIKKHSVMIGGDFLIAPMIQSPHDRVMVKYKDIAEVVIRASRGRIFGATIKTGVLAVHTGRVKDPGVIVQAIFERTPDSIRWVRSPWVFRKLSREQVKELIEKANVPDVNSLLPPSTDFTRADDLISQDQPQERVPGIRGWLGRLFGGGTYQTRDFVCPQLPTPITRYVDAMLCEMFEKGPKTRVLRRSEPLPALTVDSEMLDAPPIEDVLDRLKFMSGLDPRTRRTPIESTIHITFEGKGPSAGVPHEVLCQFDNKSDTCCQMRLERMPE